MIEIKDLIETKTNKKIKEKNIGIETNKSTTEEESSITRREQQNILEKIHTEAVKVLLSAEIVITVSFWPLFLTIPELLFKKEAIENLSFIQNICMHGVPVLFLAIDYITDKKDKMKGVRENAIALYVFVCGIVLIGYRYMYSGNSKGHWRYYILRFYEPFPFFALIFLISFMMAKTRQGLEAIKRRARERGYFFRVSNRSRLRIQNLIKKIASFYVSILYSVVILSLFITKIYNKLYC